MKKYLQKLICVPMITCVIFTGCSRQPVVYSSVDTAMGTIISQTIYVSGETADAVDTEILNCIESLEKYYLSWRLDTSEIYSINESAGSGQKNELSDTLSDILQQCQAVHTASGGAFDYTIGSLSRLWDIDAWASEGQTVQGADVSRGMDASRSEDVSQSVGYVLPVQEEITCVLNSMHDGTLVLEENWVEVPEGIQLDLGAVGKGIVLDEVKEILDRHEEVSGAVISAGGSILTYGSKTDGSNWNVAIVDPFDTSKSIGVLKLSGQWCVSTSGDYERYVEVDGVRYHHILDPATGYPADSGVKSVTVLTDSGLYSDALSTACFVLGVEKGMELAETFHAEVLFVDSRGEIFMTEGMKQYFVKQ